MPWPERWVPVLDSPRYEVSDRGAVRRGERVLRAAPNDCGYLKVSLGRSRQVYVHRIVLLSFVGEPAEAIDAWAVENPDVWTVDHIDFDVRNNALDNLRWLTLTENAARHRPEELETWWGAQRHRARRAA